MNKLLKIFFGMAIFFLFANNTAFAQTKKVAKKVIKKVSSDYIKIIDEAGKQQEFIFKSVPRFELVNGMLNISVLSEKNELFEITGISEKAIKDTMLSDNAFKMMYIFSQNVKACVSNPMVSNSILNINCSGVKTGNPILIILTGNLFGEGKILMLEAKLSGLIPDKKNITTRK